MRFLTIVILMFALSSCSIISAARCAKAKKKKKRFLEATRNIPQKKSKRSDACVIRW